MMSRYELWRRSGAVVELGEVLWAQIETEKSWEGVRDDVFREVSPELLNDKASFPFSPRPLSPPRVNSASGDEVYACMMRNSGLQPDLQLPDLLPAFWTSASSMAPFYLSTPGSYSGQHKILEDETPASDVLPPNLKVENKLNR